MSTVQSTHQFADAAAARIQGLRSEHCELHIRQKPLHAKVAVGKEKDRKPVDPPPIIQLTISHHSDPAQNYLQSPYFFMSCNLVGAIEASLPSTTLGTALAGTLVSSLHRLKDSSNNDGAFFVFGDLSIKLEGTFRLQFNLYEMRDKECFHIQSIISDPFVVHLQKTYPGMSESTFLTRSFSDQGVRLRLRKEPRTLLKKRGPASDDYQPRQYNPRSSNTSTRGGTQTQNFSHERPEEQDSSRQSQSDHLDSINLPMHPHPQLQPNAHPQSYEQRSSVARPYSHQSQQSSISIAGSYSDEGPNKRPRTGSEHSSTYSQLSPQEQFPPRNFEKSFPSSFTSPTGAYPNAGNFTFVSSPQGGIASRDQYFSQRINTQIGNSSSFDSQESPQSAQFSPHTQTHTLRYQQSLPQMGTSMGNSPTQRHYDLYGPRSQIPPSLGQLNMAPPQSGRMNTSPTTYSPLGQPMGRRNYEFPIGQLHHVSSASLVGNLMSGGTHETPMSAPGELERLDHSPAF